MCVEARWLGDFRGVEPCDGGTPETNPPDLSWDCGKDGLSNDRDGETPETNPPDLSWGSGQAVPSNRCDRGMPDWNLGPWVAVVGTPPPEAQRCDGGTPETNPPDPSQGSGKDGLLNHRGGGTPETNPPGPVRGCGRAAPSNRCDGWTLETNPSSTQRLNFGVRPQNLTPSTTQSIEALRRPRDRQRVNLHKGTIEPVSRCVHRFRPAERSGSGRQVHLPETVGAPDAFNPRECRSQSGSPAVIRSPLRSLGLADVVRSFRA